MMKEVESGKKLRHVVCNDRWVIKGKAQNQEGEQRKWNNWRKTKEHKRSDEYTYIHNHLWLITQKNFGNKETRLE